MSTTGTAHDNEMARYYLARIYHALNSLLVAPPSLGLVQCLIGVAMLISTTSSSYSMSEGHFTSTALRVIQSLAYQDDDFGMTRDTAQERRVFWLAFINDTNASIMTNCPTIYRQEDVVECSYEFESIGDVTAAEGHWKVNVFRLRVRLALLQAEATDQVLSKTTRTTSALDIEAATAMILARLQTYHDHEVFRLSPSQLFALLYRSDVCHIFSLEATYFATLFRLHAFKALGSNPKINPFCILGLDMMAKISDHKSYAAAKRLLSLVPIAPRGDVGVYWMLHRVLIAALVTVFAHHLNNPAEPSPTFVVMKEYNQLLADLTTMVQASGNAEFVQLRDLCVRLFSQLQTKTRPQ